MSSSQHSNTLESQLRALSNKASTLEGLAKKVKGNEKQLLDLAKKFLNYVLVLKKKHKRKQISNTVLASELQTLLNNITSELETEPTKTDIDDTVQQLHGIFSPSKPVSTGDGAEKLGNLGAKMKDAGKDLMDSATEQFNKISNLIPGASSASEKQKQVPPPGLRNIDGLTPERATLVGSAPPMGAYIPQSQVKGKISVGGYRYSGTKHTSTKRSRKKTRKRTKGKSRKSSRRRH